MLTDTQFAAFVADELDMEAPSTRKCLEEFNMDQFQYKPHEKSMIMGYVFQLVAEIPKWIDWTIRESDLDLATFPHDEFKNAEELVQKFEKNVNDAKKALSGITDGALDADFALKNDGKTVHSASKRNFIKSMINHMVHHRGQLTVYLRLNELKVPATYGPSADDNSFGAG